MLDRKSQPAAKIAEKIEIIRATAVKMRNGSNLYLINAGEQDVVRMEIILPTAATNGKSLQIAFATHQLTDSGTGNMNSMQIAEAFDRLGSFYQSDAGPDYRSYTIYALTTAFAQTIEILRLVLSDALFPEQEVALYKKRNAENLKVNQEKVSWIARTSFNRALFGKNHPYGFTPDESDFENLTREDLTSYHQKNALPSGALIILAGKVGENEIRIVEDAFGIQVGAKGIPTSMVPEAEISPLMRTRIPKPDAVQCGIRVGRNMFCKIHPDYIPFTITNTILGGYFGSRLMANIREDKGYTYGIGSAMSPFASGGSFFISTEVGKDVCDAALSEIYFELERMSKEPVPASEINLVRNYLLGAFQRNLDGPFALADRFKSLVLYGLDYDYLDNYLHYLNKITSDEVMAMAGKYLMPDQMTEVIAG